MWNWRLKVNEVHIERIGLMNLVLTQNFRKNQQFLLPDTHAYVRIRGNVRIASFSENFAYVLTTE